MAHSMAPLWLTLWLTLWLIYGTLYAMALTLDPHLGVQGDHPQKPEEPTTLDKKCGLSNRLRATVFAMVDAQQQYRADVR